MNIREIIEDFDFETKRKLFHLLALLSWLFPLNFFPAWLVLLVFLVVIGLNLLTVQRIGEKRFSFYYRLVYKLERERNMSKPSIQALWANLGIFLSFLLFGREPAMVSVVVLAVGDAFASIVGMRYGRTKIGDRSLEGALAFLFSSFFVLLPFVGFWKAFVVSILSALVEALPIKVDDNFIVPIVAGMIYYILS